MKKIIKKANSKWILLFLFTFFSVGVQGQLDGNTPKLKVEYKKKPEREWTEYGVNPKYLLKLPAGLVNLPSDLTINVNININIPYSGGSTPSYDWTDSSGYQYPDTFLESILNSIMSGWGSVWGTGDAASGSFDYQGSGGSGGLGNYTPPCPIKSCPVGFNLIDCKCIKDPCAEAKKNDLRASNAIILNQNNQIRTLSIEKEFGAEQNLTTFPPGTVPVFKDIPVHTDPVDPANIKPIKSFTPFFNWNATKGYTIGVSHGHPDGRAPSAADLILPATFLNNLKSLNGSPAAIDYFKANFTHTIVTANEIFTISVTDWDALETLRAEFTLNAQKARDNYSEKVQEYINAQKERSSSVAFMNKATLYAALKIYGKAVSISKLDKTSLKHVALKLDAQDIILEQF
jgi:hypothetical protein